MDDKEELRNNRRRVKALIDENHSTFVMELPERPSLAAGADA